MAEIEDAILVVEEGTLLRVTMEIRLPCAAAEDQIKEWLDMNVGRSGGMNCDNPLASYEPQDWGMHGVRFEDLGVRGREERFNHQDHGDGRSTCQVRYRRDVK